MKTHLQLLLAVVFTLTLAAARAEEKNGLSLVISKTTIDNNDTRGKGTSYDRINRTRGLNVVIGNMSIREKPEGEVVWTILVRKYSSTSVESYTGTEKLKALKPAETTDMVIGNAEISGYKDLGNQQKDKIEYRVVVTQGGKEIIKAQSTSSFDSLAKRATKATPARKDDDT